MVERNRFECDRDDVLRQIDDLRGAITSGARELEMVAAEGVFEASLAEDLLRTARSLRATAKQVGNLRNEASGISDSPRSERKSF